MTQEFIEAFDKWSEYLNQLGYRKVVLCKECNHKHIKDNVWTCPFGLPAGCDFYCGYGERKTDHA